MTAQALGRIGAIGGPRCCKRDSFLSILAACDFVKEHFGVALEKPAVTCHGITKASEAAGGHKFVVARGVRWWTKKVLPFYYA